MGARRGRRARGSGHSRKSIQYAQHEFLKIHARRPRRHRHQAVIGHAGHRIRLDQPGPTLPVRHEIDAPPAARAERRIRAQRDLLYLSLLFRRQAAGTVITRFIVLVLGFVIVEGPRRLEAYQGQSFAGEYARRIFRSADEFFRDHRAITRSQLPGAHHVVRALDLADADAGTFENRFHHQRQTEFPRRARAILRGPQLPIIRRGKSHALPHPFTAQFIHGQRATEHAAARIRDAVEVKQRLDGTVLAAAAVQNVEHPVAAGAREHLGDIGAHIDGRDVDAARAQRLQHGAPADQRDFAFGRQTAHQQCDLAVCFRIATTHKGSPTI
jgi:hypothetical protein